MKQRLGLPGPSPSQTAVETRSTLGGERANTIPPLPSLSSRILVVASSPEPGFCQHRSVLPTKHTSDREVAAQALPSPSPQQPPAQALCLTHSLRAGRDVLTLRELQRVNDHSRPGGYLGAVVVGYRFIAMSASFVSCTNSQDTGLTFFLCSGNSGC